MKPNKKVVEAIRNHPDDLNRLFTELAFAYKVSLHERETLIVFDEVQGCPQARNSPRHWSRTGVMTTH